MQPRIDSEPLIDDSKPRKKSILCRQRARGSENFTTLSQSDANAQSASGATRPQESPRDQSDLANRAVPSTPSQASPRATSKHTPTKSAVKALPTVRDHTSDQLGPNNDEYIPREFDQAGEKKVDELGYPQGGRQFRCRTFTVPKRGQKLFMLATECARVLNYRDSYLLFNKNRSLFKIIATQPEKEHLISQEILPYSYRSRQIAIVTAKSMFRQFGSRVIVNGRRVRDDYWESKAKKQGFTEDDLAGEKRPGGAKSREAAAADSQVHALSNFVQGHVVYNNGPVFDGIHPHQLPAGLAATFAPPSIMSLATNKDYSSISRPRQELTGMPYQDRSQLSSAREIMNHAAQTADFNKSLNQSRSYRGKGLDEHWSRPREPTAAPATAPVPPSQQSTTEPAPAATATSQSAYTSPRFAASSNTSQVHAPPLLPQQSSHHPTPPLPAPPAQPTLNNPAYGTPQAQMHSPAHRQNSLQSSMRDPNQYQPQGLQRPSSSASLSQEQQTSSGPSHNPYAYPTSSHQQHVWGAPPPQPHASPAMNRMQTPQFSPSLTHASGQQMPSPVQTHHQSSSPHPPQQMHPSQMLPQHTAGAGSLPGQQVYNNALSSMQGSHQPHAYPSMAGTRQMYTPGQNQSQYLPSHQAAPASMQGWPAVSHASPGSWGGY